MVGLKVFIVYHMGNFYDGNFPVFKGVYTEEPTLGRGEYCEEMKVSNNEEDSQDEGDYS